MPTARTYAPAQLIGTRSHQCDATAVRTVDGLRAYALLDGIGSSDNVRDWTRTMARRLAAAAARMGDAESGLRRVHAAAAAEPDRSAPWADLPAAVAVVAIHEPGSRLLNIAWCGDARAYLYEDGWARRLTTDHNMRQELLDAGREPGRYARNTVTSYLGDTDPKPAIGAAGITLSSRGDGCPRLLLASDGAYEPIEDAHRDIGAFLYGAPVVSIARNLVDVATRLADPAHTDNATVLVAELETR